jgi:hypothetical protein
MGSIRGSFFLSAFLSLACSLSGQAALTPGSPGTSLAQELQNLEKSLAASGPAGRREALVRIAGLKELAGDIEGAAKTWELAAQAEPGFRDHRAMLRGAACFTALGEWERAEAALKVILLENRDPETRTRARLLTAELETLRGGGADTSGLVSLLADGAFGAYKPAIYFTLWKLTGRESWRERLVEEFPRSPEGRIAAANAGRPGGAGTVRAAPTAMWLLFPGRGASGPALSAPVPPAAPAPGPAAGPVLQAGLFSRDENARALIEKLEAAGFRAFSARRDRPGGSYTIVYVRPGPDINASIRELRAAGFESFPAAGF